MERRLKLAASLLSACLLAAACRSAPASKPASAYGIPPSAAIAVSASADAIYLVDAATGRTAQVLRGLVDFNAGYATWAPDHRRLAFGDAGIEVLDALTGDQRLVAHGRSLSMPAWSPDGRRLAYSDGSRGWVSNADGSGVVQMRLPADLAPLDLTWSQDGRLAFAGLELTCAPGGCVSTERSDIWTSAPDGTGLTRVTTVGHAERPKWSPGATRLLYVRVGSSTRQLWMVGSDGSDPKRVGSFDDVVAADWSPDGGRLAILRRGATRGVLQLWTTALDGSAARTVGGPIAGTTGTVDW